MPSDFKLSQFDPKGLRRASKIVDAYFSDVAHIETTSRKPEMQKASPQKVTGMIKYLWFRLKAFFVSLRSKGN